MEMSQETVVTKKHFEQIQYIINKHAVQRGEQMLIQNRFIKRLLISNAQSTANTSHQVTSQSLIHCSCYNFHDL